MAIKIRETVVILPGQQVVPTERADRGFVRYGGTSLEMDFAGEGLAPDSTWDENRGLEAGYEILSILDFPSQTPGAPWTTDHVQHAKYNPKGLYAMHFNAPRLLNTDPTKGGTYLPKTTYYIGTMVPDDSTVVNEGFFVHKTGGPIDWTTRIMDANSGGSPRWLMRFDVKEYFDSHLAPLLDAFWRSYKLSGYAGAPAIAFDNCPTSRVDGWTEPGETWDHFTTEDAWIDGWVQLLRRIRYRYPEVRLLGNWIPVNIEAKADRVLELLDGILIEQPPIDTNMNMYLSYAYRAAKMGKVVQFRTTLEQASRPTLDEHGRNYFCMYLLTMGPGSHWAGQWVPTSGVDTGINGVNRLDLFEEWFGQPLSDMEEIQPGLWRRRLMNSEVYLNVHQYNTYKVDLQNCLDEAGDPLDSLTLAPYEGDFAFRRLPSGGQHGDAIYRRQLPAPGYGQAYKPEVSERDGLVTPVIAWSSGAENRITNSDDMTDTGTWTFSTTTVTRPADAVWQGIQFNEVTSASTPSDIRADIDVSGHVGDWLTVEFYAMAIDEPVLLSVGIDAVGYFWSDDLAVGPVPQRIRAQIEIAASPASPWILGLNAYPKGGSGAVTYRAGMFRAVITEEQFDGPITSEMIQTNGVALGRGAGFGAHGTVWATELSGYQPIDASRPEIQLLNSTKVTGLSSGGGTYAQRPTLGASDVGYQYFDTTLVKAIWWDGTAWRLADGQYADSLGIGGLDAFFRADFVTDAGGGAVSEWTDLTGHGHHAAQGTALNRPTQVASIINGQPVVRFDDADPNLLTFTEEWAQTEDCTVVAVIKYQTTSDLQALITRNTTLGPRMFVSSNAGDVDKPRYQEKVASLVSAHALSGGTNYLLKMGYKYSSGSQVDFIQVSGFTEETTAVGDTERGAWRCIGTLSDSSSAPLSCDLAELRIYNRRLSVSEYALIQAYVLARYGIAA